MERRCLVTFSAEEFYSLGNSRARAGCAWSCLDYFFSPLLFLFSPPLYGIRLCLMPFSLHPSPGDDYASCHFLSTPLRETIMPHAIFSPPLSGRRFASCHFLFTLLRETTMPHAIFSPPLSGRRLCLMPFSLHPSPGDDYTSCHFLSTLLRETTMPHDTVSKNSSVIFCRDRPRFEGSREIVH